MGHVTDIGNLQKVDSLTKHTLEESSSHHLIELKDQHGQWLRRRCLDGALNRVPIGFYSEIWLVLNQVLVFSGCAPSGCLFMLY